MSVIVKGMDMPKCCPSCPFNHETYWLSRHICVANKSKEIHINLDTGFPDDCPLGNVETPHGDLVDRDALLDKAWSNFYQHEDEWQKKDKDYLPFGRFYDQNGWYRLTSTIRSQELQLPIFPQSSSPNPISELRHS